MSIQEELAQPMPTSNGQLHAKFILQSKECPPLEFFTRVGAGVCPQDRECCKRLSIHLSIRAKLALPIHEKLRFIMCVYECFLDYVAMHHVWTESACGGQKIALGPLEVELQMLVSVGWELNPGPSARASSALNC